MASMTLEQALQMALAKHQSGELRDAERLYLQILAQSPVQPDVVNLLGVCIHQQGRSVQAEELFDHAIGLRPKQGSFYTHRGMARLAQGRTIEAVADLQQGVELDPSPDALNNLGNGLRAARDWPGAIKAYEAAIASRPAFAEAMFNLGLVHREAGELALAVESFEGTLAARPDFPNAARFLFAVLRELAQTARNLSDLPDAVEHYRRAAAVGPTDIGNWVDLATALTADHKPAEAADAYRCALAVEPQSIPLLNDLGLALQACGRLDDAIAVYDSAVALVRPGETPDTVMADLRINRATALIDAGRTADAWKDFAVSSAVPQRKAETHCAIGNLRMRQRKLGLAIGHYEKAISLRPGYADAMCNLGTAVEERGRRGEARRLYQEAIRIKPDSVSAPWNLALLDLLEGNLVEGFAGYEQRWRQKNVRPFLRSFPQPAWDGDAVNGRTILLYAEQGFGDAIQFARYVPLVAARGGRVVVEVPGPLVELFRSLEGAAEIVESGRPLPPFDLHCPLMSLPRVFGTSLATIPANVPYLSAAAARKSEAGSGRPGRLKIGLVWSGNPRHQRDSQRSIPPDQLLPLAHADADWIGLQIGSPPAPEALRLIEVGPTLRNFADTAAVIAGLDLVVTVDTAVAHLAGAMGKPVWVMLAHWPDWRWMLDRANSPWYPTMRLFRQPTPGDWRPVVRAVAGELERLQSANLDNSI